MSAAGTIAAHAQVTVQFQNSGQIKTVNVKVGDKVKAGQVLASLDTTDLEAAVASAQAGSGQRAGQARVRQERPIAFGNQGGRGVAGERPGRAAGRAEQDGSLASDQLIIEQNNVDNAAQRLNDAQNTYSNLFEYRALPGPEEEGRRLSHRRVKSGHRKRRRWIMRRLIMQVAVANYNLAAANVNDSSVQSAAAQVTAGAGQPRYARRTRPRRKMCKLAELSVKNAQIALDQAKANLNKSQLIAPFDGVVADVNIQVGQQSSASTQPIDPGGPLAARSAGQCRRDGPAAHQGGGGRSGDV